MNPVRAIGLVLFLAGFGLLAVAVARGDVGFYLVVIVPVLASDSPLFGFGLLALIAGFLLTLLGGRGSVGPPGAWAASGTTAAPAPPPPNSEDADGGRNGGLILIGPVPFFFGSWRPNAPVPYWVAVLLGLLSVAALLVLVVLFAR